MYTFHKQFLFCIENPLQTTFIAINIILKFDFLRVLFEQCYHESLFSL